MTMDYVYSSVFSQIAKNVILTENAQNVWRDLSRMIQEFVSTVAIYPSAAYVMKITPLVLDACLNIHSQMMENATMLVNYKIVNPVTYFLDAENVIEDT